MAMSHLWKGTYRLQHTTFAELLTKPNSYEAKRKRYYIEIGVLHCVLLSL